MVSLRYCFDISFNSSDSLNLNSPLTSLYQRYQVTDGTNQLSYHLCQSPETLATEKCCSCEDSCVDYGLCCIDKFLNLSNVTGETGGSTAIPVSFVELGYECRPIFETRMLERIAGSSSERYMMISRCNSTMNRVPSDGKMSSVKFNEDTRKCLTSNYDTTLESIPVLSENGDLYRSASCARCNDLNKFERLQIHMSWSGDYKQIEEWNLNDSSCYFQLSETFKKRICYHQESRIQCRDPTYSRLCNSFSSPIFPDKYANYFCYMCYVGENQIEPLEELIPSYLSCRNSSDFNGPTTPFGGWSILIDFSGKIDVFQGSKKKSGLVKCSPGFIYDVFADSCLPIEEIRRQKHEDNIDKYISIIGSCLSIFGYLLVILTYTKFKELQNVPGLCALTMTVCLLLGYVTFLLRRYSCKLFAFLSHYFLLSSQMWIVIICIDLATAIHSQIFISNSRNKMKTFKKYFLLVFFVPLPFVVTPLVLHETGQVNVGYKENGYCWIEHFPTRLYSYIIPTSLAYLIAITSLILTFKKIHHTRKETKNILESNQENSFIMRMALKLTFGLGIVDIVGFIQIPKTEERSLNFFFAMVFTAVMSCKGLFVCALYLLNRKVFKLYKSWIKGIPLNSIELKETREATTT